MCRLVIMLSAITAVMGQEQFFKKYAFTKVMTNCFGDASYYNHLGTIAAAEKQCQQLPLFNRDYPNINNIPSYSTQQLPYYADVGGQNLFVPVPSYYYPQGYYGYPNTQFHRQTRQAQQKPFFDAATLQSNIATVKAAVSNFTCTLRKLDAIDDNLNIKTDSLINVYYQIPINSNLRNDLINGLQYCQELVNCLPLERSKSSIPKELQRLVMFTKCEKKTRVAACFKDDLRKNINQFDLSALPNKPQTSDLEILMTILIGAESTEELELY